MGDRCSHGLRGEQVRRRAEHQQVRDSEPASGLRGSGRPTDQHLGEANGQEEVEGSREPVWLTTGLRRDLGASQALGSAHGWDLYPVPSAGALTILQGGGIDLTGGGPRASPIEGLDHHPVLGELLEVVQGVDLTVPGGLHLHNAVLPIAARAGLSVANLVAPYDAILQLLLGCLWVRGRRDEDTVTI